MIIDASKAGDEIGNLTFRIYQGSKLVHNVVTVIFKNGNLGNLVPLYPVSGSFYVYYGIHQLCFLEQIPHVLGVPVSHLPLAFWKAPLGIELLKIIDFPHICPNPKIIFYICFDAQYVPQMDLILVLTVIAVTLFTLLGLFLWVTKKGNKRANRFLGLFFLLWALDFLDGVLLLKGFYLNYPGFALWAEPLILLYGPLLYFYTLQLTSPRKVLKYAQFFHLSPFFVGILTMVLVYHVHPVNKKLEILRGIVGMEQDFRSLVGFALVYVHLFYYIHISKKAIRRATKDVEVYYSQRYLVWLDKVLNALIVVLLISIVNGIFQYSSLKEYFEISLTVVLILVCLFIARLILNALDEPFIVPEVDGVKRYSGTLLDTRESEEIFTKIQKALKEKRLFMESDLTLGHLSEAVGSTSRKVSQVINERTGHSFFDLINTHRIAEAQKIFKERKDPKLTVLEVMYEVGFNSKSSFNTQFKKKTGLTPSEFLKLNT